MPSFRNSFPMMLYYALDATLPQYRALFQRFDVTEQQWRILRVLWNNEKITSADLSRTTLLPPPSLVGILDRLEKKGLVQRDRSSADRREVHISVTETGRTLQEEVLPLVERIQIEHRDQLSEEEWSSLEYLLQKYTQKLSQTSK